MIAIPTDAATGLLAYEIVFHRSTKAGACPVATERQNGRTTLSLVPA